MVMWRLLPSFMVVLLAGCAGSPTVPGEQTVEEKTAPTPEADPVDIRGRVEVSLGRARDPF